MSPKGPFEDVTVDDLHRLVHDTNWNHTAAPCSMLAHAYRAGERLGPVDEATLQSCVYWRLVARSLIEEFTSMKHCLIQFKRGLNHF